jgi:hypothetical protein
MVIRPGSQGEGSLFAWMLRSRNIFCTTNSADAAAPHLTGKSLLTSSRHERVRGNIPDGSAVSMLKIFIAPRDA